MQLRTTMQDASTKISLLSWRYGFISQALKVIYSFEVMANGSGVELVVFAQLSVVSAGTNEA